MTYAVRTHYPVEMDKQELKDHVAAVVRARMDALARWEVRLVGDEERPRLRSEERQKLLDRISAEIDVLLDHEVEHLAGMLRIYGEGRERGNQK